jgi:hypothetical protein
MMKVAVFGAGPAGLMAAHAAVTVGAEVDIYSNKRKSELYGCQYLHAPIPGMTDVPPVEVRYRLHGEVEAYRRKVYGDGYDGTVSPEDLLEKHDAWDIRRTYSNLWAEYQGRISQSVLNSDKMQEFVSISSHDFIINSVPRGAICHNPSHKFPAEEVIALGDAPERGIFAPNYSNNNEVICNGLDEPSWYRAAKVFGYATVEWPYAAKLDKAMLHASVVAKPLETDCDCYPGVIHVGRYGRWQKGVLSHTAFQQVLDALATERVS